MLVLKGFEGYEDDKVMKLSDNVYLSLIDLIKKFQKEINFRWDLTSYLGDDITVIELDKILYLKKIS